MLDDHYKLKRAHDINNMWSATDLSLFILLYIVHNMDILSTTQGLGGLIKLVKTKFSRRQICG